MVLCIFYDFIYYIYIRIHVHKGMSISLEKCLLKSFVQFSVGLFFCIIFLMPILYQIHDLEKNEMVFISSFLGCMASVTSTHSTVVAWKQSSTMDERGWFPNKNSCNKTVQGRGWTWPPNLKFHLALNLSRGVNIDAKEKRFKDRYPRVLHCST